MRATKMPTDHFEMAPLDEFVVTEHKYKNGKIALPQIEWSDWRDNNDHPPYELLMDPKTNKERNIHQKQPKPTDVEVVLDQNDIDLGYYITWD
jgi:hypothetical protein